MHRIGGNKIDPIKIEALRIRQNRELVHRHEHCDRSVRLVGIILLTAPRNCGRPVEMGPDWLPRMDRMTCVGWFAATVIPDDSSCRNWPDH